MLEPQPFNQQANRRNFGGAESAVFQVQVVDDRGDTRQASIPELKEIAQRPLLGRLQGELLSNGT